MKCPSCSKELVKHFDSEGKEYLPVEGDLGVCLDCGTRNIVHENKLVLMTPEIFKTLPPMDRVQYEHLWKAWSYQHGMKGS